MGVPRWVRPNIGVAGFAVVVPLIIILLISSLVFPYIILRGLLGIGLDLPEVSRAPLHLTLLAMGVGVFTWCVVLPMGRLSRPTWREHVGRTLILAIIWITLIVSYVSLFMSLAYPQIPSSMEGEGREKFAFWFLRRTKRVYKS